MEKRTLVPIGAVAQYGEFSVIKILSKYNKALLKLNTFSHMLVFTNENEKVGYCIACITKVYMNKGIVITNCLSLPDNTVIYDIKPYVPCEDRIDTNTYANIKSLEFNQQDIDIEPQNDTNSKTLQIQYIGQYQFHNGKQNIVFNHNHDLSKIKSNQHVRLLWWFDKFDHREMRKTVQVNPPYENAPRTGVFATRSPVRPNLIASTIVKVLGCDEQKNTLYVQGFDGFTGTGIIDAIEYKSSKENIEDVYVPEYLAHWPEHVSFSDETAVKDDQRLAIADADELMRMTADVSTIDSKSINCSKRKPQKDCICIIGANENNLKNVSVNIPKNKLTVITGVSGSGKSSLAFDTLFKECQHQYMDIMGSNNNVAVEKPKVEEITGLMPAVAITQKRLGNNPRSTVGTITGVSGQMRQLYALIGTRHCPQCHRPVKALLKGEIVYLLNKISLNNHVEIYPFAMDEVASVYNGDEIKIHEFLDKGKGALYAKLNKKDVYLLQTKEYCYHCNRIFFNMSVTMFSPNSPEHMCPACKGLGEILKPSEDLIVHNKDISILDGASRLWGNLRKFMKKPNANWMKGQVLALAIEMGVDLETPYKDLPREFKYQLLHGSDGREVTFDYNAGGRNGVITRPVEGVLHIINRLMSNTTSTNTAMAESFMKKTRCEKCNGEKLVTESRLVSIETIRYPEAMDMSITELREWIQQLIKTLPKHKLVIVESLLESIAKKLERVCDLGLSYLTLSRSASTLSGGEGQRIRLTSQFNNALSNILYVLDEPTMSLHPTDYKSMISKLKELCHRDNTVVVVEHKKDVIRSADYIIDVGKGAGKYGGEIIASGNLDMICESKDSVTGKYLNTTRMSITEAKFDISCANKILLTGAKSNNLKNIDVEFPKESFVCVTGVSGSGKSTLVSDTLCSAILSRLEKKTEGIGEFDCIEGIDDIYDVINITQSPIGRTPRSTPATYTGVFDFIREEFANTQQAKIQEYQKEHFSFNSKSGQCSVCKGMGKVQHKLGFIDDIWTSCPVCKGKRYKDEIIEIEYKGYSISDILDMEVREASVVFANHEKIIKVLSTLIDVGLGYIKLGQSAVTLSGGEAQRIKLANGLSKTLTNHCVYILDEPTVGLHFDDISKLIGIIKKLSKNNTVIAVDHNLDFISNADYIIDMGPAGGTEGGHIVASGSPYEIMSDKKSITGEMLKRELEAIQNV